MAFNVRVADTAMRDAQEYRAYILQRSHDYMAADRWWGGLFDAIASLEILPTRCPRIGEREGFSLPLQQLLYASHRIVFWIDADTVQILRVYPCWGRPLTSLRQRARHGKRP